MQVAANGLRTPSLATGFASAPAQANVPHEPCAMMLAVPCASHALALSGPYARLEPTALLPSLRSTQPTPRRVPRCCRCPAERGAAAGAGRPGVQRGHGDLLRVHRRAGQGVAGGSGPGLGPRRRDRGSGGHPRAEAAGIADGLTCYDGFMLGNMVSALVADCSCSRLRAVP